MKTISSTWESIKSGYILFTICLELFLYFKSKQKNCDGVLQSLTS